MTIKAQIPKKKDSVDIYRLELKIKSNNNKVNGMEKLKLYQLKSLFLAKILKSTLSIQKKNLMQIRIISCLQDFTNISGFHTYKLSEFPIFLTNSTKIELIKFMLIQVCFLPHQNLLFIPTIIIYMVCIKYESVQVIYKYNIFI